MEENVKSLYVKRTQRDYPLSFKLAVVREVESGAITNNGAMRKYGIQGHGTIVNWRRKFGNFEVGNTVTTNFMKSPQQKIAELSEERINRDEAEVVDHGHEIEKDNTDELSRYEINREARIAAKEFLDCLSDYDCSEWDPEDGRHIIKDIIKYKGKPITIIVLSSRSRKLYLHPRAFAELMEDPDNLLLNYGYDKKIHSLSFEDIFLDNPNVNLIFDTDIVSPKEIATLANKYMYSKKTCFVVENPKYSQSDIIKSFGLNEKKEDGSVMLGLSDEDIFNFGND